MITIFFDTYVKEAAKVEQPVYTTPIPTPPTPSKPEPIQEPAVKFLDPLKITLKGIIAVTDDTKNRAIIQDNATKKESVYKAGDIIDDAQLIKIFNKKVIFLRANGQQEILYLRTKDAELDPAYAAIDDWKTVAHKVTETSYNIDPQEISRRIKSLAQFIDLLDLTTVYQKGTSIGVRIGKLQADSLGTALGVQVGDMIVSVDGIPADDTQNRLKIYKKTVAMKLEGSIPVLIRRKNKDVTLTFTFDELTKGDRPAKIKTTAPATGKPMSEAGMAHQIDQLKDRHKFAPTLSEIRNQERKKMFEKGRLSLPTAKPQSTELKNEN